MRADNTYYCEVKNQSEVLLLTAVDVQRRLRSNVTDRTCVSGSC